MDSYARATVVELDPLLATGGHRRGCPADACTQRAVELIDALTGQPVWTWTDAAAVSLSTGSAYRALSRRGGPCDKEQPGEIVREPEALPHTRVVADGLSAQRHRPGRER